MHNCTLQEEDNASDSDETAEKKKKKKKKKKKRRRQIHRCACLYASACICYASACICYASVCICYASVCIEYSLNTPALEALREPVLSRKCGSRPHGLPAERQDSLYTSPVAALFETLCVCRAMRKKK